MIKHGNAAMDEHLPMNHSRLNLNLNLNPAPREEIKIKIKSKIKSMEDTQVHALNDVQNLEVSSSP